MGTFFWHDYETWGTDPSVDRPAQFAGVRTDEDLNIIGEPLRLYCRPAPDVLPHPEACLVTGIAPQKALNEGLIEAEFIARIHAELAAPGTCGVGYNSIRFDDEVTRYTLYRNFFDPYEREWANGNSRWDIIDMVRLCYALRPEGIEWPVVEGRVSFRLELLTQANGISHAAAHDAYSDVEATIELARLIKSRQPQLYDYVVQHKHKSKVASLIDLINRKPLLHISSKFSAENGCTGLVMPLAMHPVNKNAVIVFNLSADPSDLIALDAEQIAARVFTSQEDLPEGEDRIPLKLIHLNKCPVLATPKLLDDKTAARLKIDKARCERHWQQLLNVDLKAKVQQVMGGSEFPPRKDAERQLYDGFIPDADKQVMAQVRAADAAQLAQHNFVFQDKRLREMVWRYKARNFPQSLNPGEKAQWMEFCRDRLANGDEGILSVMQLQERIRELDEAGNLNKDQKIVLQQLFRYSRSLAQEYQLGAKCCW
jgi:exodeoxyribonuclease-1